MGNVPRWQISRAVLLSSESFLVHVCGIKTGKGETDWLLPQEKLKTCYPSFVSCQHTILNSFRELFCWALILFSHSFWLILIKIGCTSPATLYSFSSSVHQITSYSFLNVDSLTGTLCKGLLFCRWRRCKLV